MRKSLFVACVCLVIAGSSVSAASLSYVDLVKRLTDLERLSVIPAPGEKCMQWSSYDRASRFDIGMGTYVGWDANGDGGGVIRKEGDVAVIAEMEGPGCIWRIWSAAPRGGHVKIYLEGNPTPVVDLPFASYFDLSSEPFVYPSIVHDAASGKNSYVPIPFQTRCKITAGKDWGDYYQFTYSLFPKGTMVPTFIRNLGQKEKAALAAADKFLTENLGTDPAGRRKNQVVLERDARLYPGGVFTAAKLSGPRAITAIKVRLDRDDYPEDALRELVLRIYWDGEKTPSVWVPLGDFFGTAPGINLYKSLPLGMTEEGFYSYWYMPFLKRAVVELVNEGKTAVNAQVTLTHAPLTRPVKELARFHAKWHRDVFLPEKLGRWIDWPMLKTQGKGRFCGVMLAVWNPRGGWWGEGDEKFFVDGEKFPSTFGTGSEDYFGYAWCNPTLFQKVYHNQTRSENNAGNISVNRWHITDNVPFHTSFEGCIEKYFPNSRPTLYSATAYWYLAPGGTDPYGTHPLNQRIGYYVRPQRQRIEGAIEGEAMKIIETTGGRTQIQPLYDGWSGDAQLWWTNAEPGDRLVLALPVKDAGSYDLKVQLTKAADYGIVQFWLDGEGIGDPIDLYNNGVILSGVISLGTRRLTSGDHRLGVEIAGANPNAIKSYMFGLDYVKLDPAK